jgi:hypothetical protein
VAMGAASAATASGTCQEAICGSSILRAMTKKSKFTSEDSS